MSSLPPLADATTSLPLPSTTSVVLGIVETTFPSSKPVLSAVSPSMGIAPLATAAVTTTTAGTPVVLSTVMSRQPTVPVNITNATKQPYTSAVTAGSTTTTKSASSKSKKKTGAIVTMATAATAQSTNGNVGSSGENTGRWTAEEHNLFLQGLELHGKGWKKIAGLIKSRTVVQIRTHAQKYFQKLAKAKQNGEEVGMAGGNNVPGAGVGNAMSMMNSNGGALSNGGAGSSSNAQTNKRRKQTSGTKRKAIQSVVASARREGNKRTAVRKSAQHNMSSQYDLDVTNQICLGDTANNALTPMVAPALAPYVLPFDVTPISNSDVQPSGTTVGGIQSHGTILEDSLFRYLTPTPIAPPEIQVNSVARQAGANPITLPTSLKTANNLAGGEISPTGVTDLDFTLSWNDISKDMPSWYAKGSDVDALLDVADTLDWLTDTGELNETYEEVDGLNAAAYAATVPSSNDVPTIQKEMVPVSTGSGNPFYVSSSNVNSMSTNTLPRMDSGAEVNVPPLPSLFDGGVTDVNDSSLMKSRSNVLSSSPSVANLVDDQLFSSPIEESDFVSCIMNDTS